MNTLILKHKETKRIGRVLSMDISYAMVELTNHEIEDWSFTGCSVVPVKEFKYDSNEFKTEKCNGCISEKDENSFGCQMCSRYYEDMYINPNIEKR